MQDLEIVLAFDQSTTNTGYTIAHIDRADNSIVFLTTGTIRPPKTSPKDLGFLKQKGTFENSKGKKYTSLLRARYEEVPYTEAMVRNRLYKHYNERTRYNYIVQGIINLIDETAPHIVVLEQNMAFRNQDITRMLAEIASAIKTIGLAKNIPVEMINVHHARVKWKLLENMPRYAATHNVARTIDITKDTLKWLVLQKYPTFGLSEDMTLDESDSLIIFDDWYTRLLGEDANA